MNECFGIGGGCQSDVPLLSIKAGRITASTLLRKLGTYSRKNRLYQAFRELGGVIRTEFLLKYINSAEMRTLIQAATNKSEAFNGFSQWVAFGGDGTITSNNRDEQRKIIKYITLLPIASSFTTSSPSAASSIWPLRPGSGNTAARAKL